MRVGAVTAGAVVLGVLLAGCGDGPKKTDQEIVRSALGQQVTVKYLVDAVGTADNIGSQVRTASLTIATSSGIRQTGADLPLTSEAGGEGLTYEYDAGAAVVISAQKSEDWYGDIRCRIVASDGTVISENSSSGSYAVVSCNGRAR